MNLHNLPMKGRVIRDYYYRVGRYLWDQADTQTKKQRIVDTYIRRGFERGYEEPITLLGKMKLHWKQFKEYDLEEPKLLPNKKIMNVYLSNSR